MSRRIAFLIYPNFQLLDATGPIAAFEIADRYRPNSYSLEVVATAPGRVASSSGVSVHARSLPRPAQIDTLIIAGGDGSRAAVADLAIRRFVTACAVKSRRVTTVCSGSYILAAAGLLDGKSATTHWSRTHDFSQRYPQVKLDADRIFVREGKFWTSAGITAGIDLSLALIAEDLGEDIARRTAQQLVVYYRRPGGQSQFSPLLQMERADGRFAGLLDHVRTKLRSRLTVDDLARFCAMSPRHFSRTFKTELGVSPARAVERIRVDTARAALESGTRSIQAVASTCGFGNAERMRRSFLRLLGSSPSAIRLRTGRCAAARRIPSLRVTV